MLTSLPSCSVLPKHSARSPAEVLQQQGDTAHPPQGQPAGSNIKRVLRNNIRLKALFLPRQDATPRVTGNKAGGSTSHSFPSELREPGKRRLGRAASDCHLEASEKRVASSPQTQPETGSTRAGSHRVASPKAGGGRGGP